MRRFLFLFALGGFLSFALGCSSNDKAIPPKEVPPMPKGPPKAGDPTGTGTKAETPGAVMP